MINIWGIFMEPVVTQFIGYPKGYQETGCQADGKARNVDKGIAFMPDNVSKRGFKIVFNHDKPPVLSIIASGGQKPFREKVSWVRTSKSFSLSKVFGGVGTFFQKGPDPPEAPKNFFPLSILGQAPGPS
jgi:hypothetical protein